MAADCFIVRDQQGHELAGPFSEGTARIWVAFNYSRYPSLAIICVDQAWEPLAAYESAARVPAHIWTLQREGRAIVVVVSGGQAKVLA